MKSSLDLFTHQELLDEIGKRLTHDSAVSDKDQCNLGFALEPTPYEVMLKMINNGWKEDIRIGKSNRRITKMWHYLGYPTLTDDDAYCAGTVNACLKATGYEVSDFIPSSRSFDTYGKDVKLSEAKVGDIVVFHDIKSNWKGHVGFVAEIDEENGQVMVAGGNQNNKMCVKAFPFTSSRLELFQFRRISTMLKSRPADMKILREWNLF